MSAKNSDLHGYLKELAMDLHWTWNHATDKVWRQLDPILWELTNNPLVVLQTVSKDRINQVLEDPIVREVIEELINQKRQRAISPIWFQKNYSNRLLTHIAYFSMEFMLSEALPIYSGGLGNVAGDYLKTASDLGVPLIGIGLLYQQAYPRQIIYKNGTQQYIAPYNDPGQLPIVPLRYPNGEWIRIEIKLPGYSIWLRTWKAQVGRVSLLLLDSNDAANDPFHRGITSELYGGDAEIRLLQEIILGIGGWRLLKAMGLNPEVCHFNEGHSAFAILERARIFMKENNQPFDVALNITRGGNIFTTHTATGGGVDIFSLSIIEHYLSNYIKEELGISLQEFFALGRKNPDDETEEFHTGYLAIKGSRYITGVSKLHCNVSKEIFAPLFPRWPKEEVPIAYVTNGVHMSTWDSPEADNLWTEACGKDRWMGSVENLKQNITSISDVRLWEFRSASEIVFIDYIRKRYARQLASIGSSSQEIEAAQHLFDPGILTVGFARRFVKYKRPNLLLQDPERLSRIIGNKERPIQLILAGKAHPGDPTGQSMIKEWVQFIENFQLANKVIFLSDYDMELTEQLVRGIDLWFNTPQRPWEACGTSGMKVLVNGGLNLSELDGWWDEAYSPEIGWAFGDRTDHDGDPLWDKEEAGQIYDLLENQIIPTFYTRNKDGIPEGWVNLMRKSMAMLTPRYSSNRALQEYTEKYYLPAAKLYQERAANDGNLGKQIVDWKNYINNNWEHVSFNKLIIETIDKQHHFYVDVFLNEISTHDILVELYAFGIDGKEPVRQSMEIVKSSNNTNTVTYAAKVSAERPATDYTPRILPYNKLIAIPLECNNILWHH
jgi:starch phosphorylase